MELTLRKIAQLTGGILLSGDPETVIRHLSFDSRKMLGDDLFIPTVGERVDGHDFIGSAFENGAAATLTSRAGRVTGTKPYVFVPDTVTALQQIGRYAREEYEGRVIGVTGSVGKTTTREMTKAALSAGGPVTGSERNMNSQLGTPVMLFHMDHSAPRAVMEMGVSEPGEMSRLAAMVQPHLVIVTNIGVAHIESLGSREGICEEKMHIADGLGPKDCAILNGEEPLLLAYREKLPCRCLYYGFREDLDVSAKDVEEDGDGIRFTAVFRQPYGGAREIPVTLNVPGVHNVLNALAALAAAWTEGVDLPAAAKALGEFGGFKRRLERLRVGGLTVIDDSYNAGPPSMKAALSVLEKAKGGRRIALLADMLELGADSAALHREVGEYAAGLSIELFITLGTEIRNLERPLVEALRPVFHCDTWEEAEARVVQLAENGDVLLLKGSNIMKLDKVLEKLKTEEKFLKE